MRGFFRKIYFTIFVLLIAIFLVSHVSDRVSYIARAYITLPVRNFLIFFTNLVPFPLFEVLSGIVIAFIALSIYKIARGRGSVGSLLLVLSFFISGYIISIGIDSTAKEKENIQPSYDEILFAGENIADELVKSCLELESCEMNESQSEVFATIKLDNTLIIPKAKYSFFSKGLTRLGVLSYYSPFTMEIVANKEQPSFMLRFSLVHELAHYLGYIREDEATLYAFSTLVSSQDAYNRYSAYLYAYILVGSYLYSKSYPEYVKIYDKLPPRVKKDLKKREEFLAGEGENSLGDRLNNGAIELVDGRGAMSYTNSINLIVNYILQDLLLAKE